MKEYSKALSQFQNSHSSEYRFWVEQARRLPIDMASRYRVAAVRA